jgi:hypothetical protein
MIEGAIAASPPARLDGAPDEKLASRAWLCHILRRFEGSVFRGYSGASG